MVTRFERQLKELEEAIRNDRERRAQAGLFRKFLFWLEDTGDSSLRWLDRFLQEGEDGFTGGMPTRFLKLILYFILIMIVVPIIFVVGAWLIYSWICGSAGRYIS